MISINRCIKKLAARPDLWKSPIKTLIRNISWNAYWSNDSPPYLVLKKWHDGLFLVLPNTSNSKLAYCGRHPESTVISAMNSYLRDGTVFIDVGAHIGVYSLLAAKKVGARGLVFGIDPQTVGIESIKLSAALNGINNLCALNGVLGRETKSVKVDFESSGAVVVTDSYQEQCSHMVDCWSLDDFAMERGLKEIHLIKLDAGGNELSVLEGSGHYLRNHLLKAIVMKFYNPDIVQKRFGISPWNAISLLHLNGYKSHVFYHGKKIELTSIDIMKNIFEDGSYCHVVLSEPV